MATMKCMQAQHQQSLRSGHPGDLSQTNEGLWVEPEDYMNRIPGYPEYSSHPAGSGNRDEFDYPDVVNYNPGSNYSEHITNDPR